MTDFRYEGEAAKVRAAELQREGRLPEKPSPLLPCEECGHWNSLKRSADYTRLKAQLDVVLKAHRELEGDYVDLLPSGEGGSVRETRYRKALEQIAERHIPETRNDYQAIAREALK